MNDYYHCEDCGKRTPIRAGDCIYCNELLQVPVGFTFPRDPATGKGGR